MIGRKAWESVGKAPPDATNPEIAPDKIYRCRHGVARRPTPPEERREARETKHTSAEGAVAYVLKKHKRRLSF